MNIQDIASEQHLRDWLTREYNTWNIHNRNQVAIDWIEPSYGSTMGISDCKLSYKRTTTGLELKHLYERKAGVCYKIRPVQRRYNVMGTKAGKRLLIFASVVIQNRVELVMIRGDRTPLRDYCSMQGSGCESGVIQTVVPLYSSFSFILDTITDEHWWK